ncbi:global DNA-binding transcriptional dual regulator Fis [Roseivivax sp. THAF40]|uniref:transcriptional regulator PpsR n=1 Tax=unclassified Roseivivax TaxID=2639302 RepID=UPI00126926EB|nr:MULTISPECIES: transcriptional regulator PpsR [unclassified Roseivivax]QFS84765.1 global DNA-binding transcriptional dual regulator Fis [Roseivivax sp. THAF197b]QFT48592.1 global DNA-binding transcriptional dual regulator Fis [Roseivivax sp. THAF40]
MSQREAQEQESGRELADSRDALNGLLTAACDIALLIDGESRILDVLGEKAPGKTDSWVGQPIGNVLTVESLPKLENALKTFRETGSVARPVELNHEDGRSWEFPIRYSFYPDPSGRGVLLLGRDLSIVAETQAQLVQAQMSLEQGYEARREFDARYRLLLRTVQDPIVFVSVTGGRIKDLNDPAAALLGSSREDFIGAIFANEFHDRGREEFIESLLNAAISEGSQPVTARVRRGHSDVSFVPHVFRAAGERVLILRLDEVGGSDARGSGSHDEFAALFEQGPDAMVLTTASGLIQSANDSFLEMIDAAHLVDVKGRKLSDFLSRGQIDMNVVTENARRAGKMRFYATKVTNEFGAETSIEMSATMINTRSEPMIGFIIRDSTRTDSLRRSQMHASEESSRNVMELVGSATLKEIVAETTDVVEKMCIETAVNLTRNNRVAAAEMLGLSRQSLYVKLRKYGLLNRESGDQD